MTERDTDTRDTTRLEYCADLVEMHDPDRFLTAMTAEGKQRGDLIALYAFNLEVARTREAVSEPMLGQIRLQWWRDAIGECFGEGKVREHWVVQSLADIAHRHDLPRDILDGIVDAREADLDPEPPKSLAEFENYCRVTGGSVTGLAARILGAQDEGALKAAEDAGAAWAIVGTVRALPFTLRRKDWVLPEDLMAEAGVTRESLGRLEISPELSTLIDMLLDRAATLNRDARRMRRALPKTARPAMAQARLTDTYIRQLKKAGNNPFDKRLATPPAMRALSVAWAVWSGRW